MAVAATHAPARPFARPKAEKPVKPAARPAQPQPSASQPRRTASRVRKVEGVRALEARIAAGFGHELPVPYYRMVNRRFVRELL